MMRRQNKNDTDNVNFANLLDSLMTNNPFWSRHSPPPMRSRPPHQRFFPGQGHPSHGPQPFINGGHHRNGRAPPQPRQSPGHPPYTVPQRWNDSRFQTGYSPSGPRSQSYYHRRPKYQPKGTSPPKMQPAQNENKSLASRKDPRHIDEKPQQPPKPASEYHEKPPSTEEGLQESVPKQPLPSRETTPPSSIAPPPSTPTRTSPDSFRIHYLVEKERLAPSIQKPSAIHFFTSSPTFTTEESRSTGLRPISGFYHPEAVFGKAPPRKCEVRDVPVTFPEIWNREVLRPKWSALRQDGEGWLDFKEFTARLQLQRHHGPGTLFFVVEGGDQSVLCDGIPDIAFRLVDSPGQIFERVGRCDLQTSFHGECGDGAVVGVDGQDVKFEIEEGGRQVRILGEGMAKDWEGKERGDLIIDIES